MTAITLGVAELGQKLEWESISGAVNRLFELKRYPELAHRLHELNEKVRAISKSELGQFIGEYYLDHILAPCMEKLGSELAGETGAGLVSKLTDIWTQFYTSILPTLLAIFASVQHQQNKLSIRSLTLLSFRDQILLRGQISENLVQYQGDFPPQIKQMLLVLQSVHSSPPSENFFTLQDLVGQIVESYLPMVSKIPLHHIGDRSPLLGANARDNRARTMDILDGGTSSQKRKNRLSLGDFDAEDTTSRSKSPVRERL